ncbi:hypothetical protein B0H14DRAFT_2851030 [Mycena olivaceomarginata]|nr:hypothetical protein B0H14DRAFT_2851030 [Mycena olivaceomarginata]
MPLDTRGIISAAQLGAYVPIAGVSLFLVIRYALRRDAGWLFLLMKNPSPDLFIAAYIMFYAGLAVLMLATIGFLGLACGSTTYSEYLHTTRMAIAFFIIIAMALAIAGGILGTHLAPAQGHIGDILRKTSAALYGALSYRRRLLAGVLCALPFLGARVAYGILAAFSSSDIFGLMPASNASLAMFHPVTGKWIYFLVLGFVCELVVAALYTLSGTVLARSRRHR